MSMDNAFSDSKSTLDALYQALASVIYTEPLKIKKVIAVFASGGHLLLEDLPGTGKTTLAKTLAKVCHAKFNRIQFTPDVLPSDITGVSIFDMKTQQFRFEEGPVFANILLADEINRASPRTQSALLEAMAEKQVSIDKKQYALPQPFFVIATQNPVESMGTFPLPEAQLDRFAMRMNLGYLSEDQEVELLASNANMTQHDFTSTVTSDDLLRLRDHVDRIHISVELCRYIVKIVTATRNHQEIAVGASPRASLAIMRAAKALSLIDGYDFVRPDAIHLLVEDMITHRLVSLHGNVLTAKEGQKIIQQILNSMPHPH